MIKTKKIITLILALLVLSSFVLSVEVTDAGNAEDEDVLYSRKEGFLEKLFSFPFAFVVEGADNPLDVTCNNFDGNINIFSKYYQPETVVKVGGRCAENAKVILFECAGDNCDRLTKQGTGYRIDGISPKFTGWNANNRYAYKCFNCDQVGNQEIAFCEQQLMSTLVKSCVTYPHGLCSPDGRYYCRLGNLIAIESSLQEGWSTDLDYICEVDGEALNPSFQVCPSDTSCLDGTCKPDELKCQPNYEWCSNNNPYKCSSDGKSYNKIDTCQLNEVCKERTFDNAVCELKEKRYHLQCVGNLCYCIEHSSGEYIDINACNAEADRKTEAGETDPNPFPEKEQPSDSAIPTISFGVIAIIILVMVFLIIGVVVWTIYKKK